jgi:hypothetical protein
VINIIIWIRERSFIVAPSTGPDHVTGAGGMKQSGPNPDSDQ